MNSNVGVPTLGVETIARIPVAVPPIAEQTAIVGPLDASEYELALEHQALQKLQRLRVALASDLLTGRMSVTHLNKETAA
jgi:restriction endonuclease S subunit